MSVSYIVHIVCGFQVNVVESTKMIKKYHEDSGEPYSLEVFSHNEGFINNKKIFRANDKYQFSGGSEYEGLEIIGGYYEDNEILIAKKIVSIDLNYSEGSPKPFLNNVIPVEIIRFVDKFNIDVAPQFYLAADVG